MTRSSASKILRAAIYSVAVEAGLRTLPLPRLAQALGIRLKGQPIDSPGVGPEELMLSVHATDQWLRHWPSRGRCLRRSLVLGALLRRHGPVLRIGVRRGDTRLRAHAWIEIAGQAVADARDVEFQALR